MTLRRHLFRMAFFTCLPVVLFAGYLSVSDIDMRSKAITERSRVIATSIRLTLDGELATKIAGLKVLADLRKVTSLPGEDDFLNFYEEAAAFSREQGTNIVVVEPDGQQIMNTALPLGTPLPKSASPEALVKVFAEGKPAITNVFTGAVHKKPVIAVDVPVIRNERTQRVLRLVLLADVIQNIVVRTPLPQGWGVAILDSTGRFVARTRNPAPGEMARPGLPEAIAAHAEWVDTVTREGIPVSNILVPSNVAPWTVVVGIPKAELSWPVVRATATLAVTAVITLIVAAVLATVFGRRIIVAINRLSAEEEGPSGVLEVDEVAERLRRARAELRLGEEHQRALRKEAERANRAKSEFLAMVSHEIRTPMNGVLGMTRLVLDGKLEPHQRERVEVILDSGTALMAILDDILDLSKLEAGRVELETATFSVRRMVSGTIALLSSRATEKGLELRAEVSDAIPPWVSGDGGRLRQVLLNLVGNAVKFTDKGAVDVAVTTTGTTEGGETTLRFDIVDTGIGMSADVQKTLFKPFTQADASISRRFGGTGLGLAICKHLVELMGGRIGVESESGVGSRFWFEIPFRAAGDDADAVAAKPSSEATGPLSILVAEDNPINQRVAAGLLARLGHAVTLAANGEEAVQAVRAGRFDLVLMDVQMPGIDGLEATRIIRAIEGEIGSIPIIAMTAGASMSDRSRCIEAGMNGYIRKPVAPEDLQAALTASTGGKPKKDAPPPPAAPVVFDRATLDELCEALGPESVDDLLRLFIDMISDRTNAVGEACVRSDLAAAAAITHELKSNARTIGLQILASRLEAVDEACREGNAEAAVRLSAVLPRCVEEALQALKADYPMLLSTT